jgi:hypothetical protein
MTTININRAPVLTLWAAVVAEQLGYDKSTALSLAQAVAGMNAQAKGERIGIYAETDGKPENLKNRDSRRRRAAEVVHLLGQTVPVSSGQGTVRASLEGELVQPEKVARYLEGKFGGDLATVREAMEAVASSYTKEELETKAYDFYEQFRPSIPEGTNGWGAKGELNLTTIKGLAKKKG